MGWLGLTWDTVFKQCANVEAAGRVLLSNFRSAKTGRTPQEALRVALSMYNTGSQSRGFRNGYVARVENAGRRVSGRPATAIPTVIVGDQPASAAVSDTGAGRVPRSEEHTSELQSLMRISYSVFCLKKTIPKQNTKKYDYDQSTHN